MHQLIHSSQRPYKDLHFTDGESKWSAPGHSASKWQGCNSIPSSQAPEPILLSTNYSASLGEAGRKATLHQEGERKRERLRGSFRGCYSSLFSSLISYHSLLTPSWKDALCNFTHTSSYIFLFMLFPSLCFFLGGGGAALHSLWDLSSPTRDQTKVPGSGSVES